MNDKLFGGGGRIYSQQVPTAVVSFLKAVTKEMMRSVVSGEELFQVLMRYAVSYSSWRVAPDENGEVVVDGGRF